MDTQRSQPMELSTFVGGLLVLAGGVLFLIRLQVLDVHWPRLLWPAVSVGSFVVLVQAFRGNKRGVIFFASLAFFVSAFIALRWWEVAPLEETELLPNLLIGVGLSYLMLYLNEPRNLAMLVPVILFAGSGAAYYLWWYEVLDMYDFRRAVRTYWPTLLMLWGAGMILRRRKVANSAPTAID